MFVYIMYVGLVQEIVTNPLRTVPVLTQFVAIVGAFTMTFRNLCNGELPLLQKIAKSVNIDTKTTYGSSVLGSRSCGVCCHQVLHRSCRVGVSCSCTGHGRMRLLSDCHPDHSDIQGRVRTGAPRPPCHVLLAGAMGPAALPTPELLVPIVRGVQHSSICGERSRKEGGTYTASIIVCSILLIMWPLTRSPVCCGYIPVVCGWLSRHVAPDAHTVDTETTASCGECWVARVDNSRRDYFVPESARFLPSKTE